LRHKCSHEEKSYFQIDSNDFDYISVSFGPSPKIRYICDICGKVIVGALGDQKQNTDSVEIGFNVRTEFVTLKYSITNNGLYSNSRIRFQDNRESVHCQCIGFAAFTNAADDCICVSLFPVLEIVASVSRIHNCITSYGPVGIRIRATILIRLDFTIRVQNTVLTG
jgi:hypothetical protein